MQAVLTMHSLLVSLEVCNILLNRLLQFTTQVPTWHKLNVIFLFFYIELINEKIHLNYHRRININITYKISWVRKLISVILIDFFFPARSRSEHSFAGRDSHCEFEVRKFLGSLKNLQCQKYASGKNLIPCTHIH